MILQLIQIQSFKVRPLPWSDMESRDKKGRKYIWVTTKQLPLHGKVTQSCFFFNFCPFFKG